MLIVPCRERSLIIEPMTSQHSSLQAAYKYFNSNLIIVKPNRRVLDHYKQLY